MADDFSTNAMMKGIEVSTRPSSFLLDLYFPEIQTHDTGEIHFDVVSGARLLAPLVSPVVEGQIVQERGFTAHKIEPAYVKPKTPLSPSGALKRRAGEKIGGSTPAASRQVMRAADALHDQIKMITRRKEWMAAEALLSGSITLSGEKYPEQVVDYGRDAALTVTLGAGSQWGDAGVNPYDDIQDWVLLVQKTGAAASTDITMGPGAWKLFSASSQVQDKLIYRNDISTRLNSTAHAQTGGIYQGSIGGLNFYTYVEFYEDDNGVTQSMLPDNAVILGGRGIEGVQAHGAILDDAANFHAVEFFPKSWVENDPPMRMVMTQSAPLVVPCNINASMAVIVR